MAIRAGIYHGKGQGARHKAKGVELRDRRQELAFIYSCSSRTSWINKTMALVEWNYFSHLCSNIFPITLRLPFPVLAQLSKIVRYY